MSENSERTERVIEAMTPEQGVTITFLTYRIGGRRIRAFDCKDIEGNQVILGGDILCSLIDMVKRGDIDVDESGMPEAPAFSVLTP